MNESSKVLGIDPGSRKTGYGLIMFNQKPILIKAGTIETKGDHNDRFCIVICCVMTSRINRDCIVF